MTSARLPWGKWYAETALRIRFPERWDVRVCTMEPRRALSPREIEARIDRPIGTAPLEELARSRATACLVVDDITRPTPAEGMVSTVLGKLNRAGIPDDRITILMAGGAHRPMTGRDARKKLGCRIPERVTVLGHDPFAADLVQVDAAAINKVYARAELKISVGCVVPHSLAGFSGGAKNIIPGIGGIETLRQNHTLAFHDRERREGFVVNTLDHDNPLRRNLEAIVSVCGLDFIINAVFNSDLEIAGVFAGHYVHAHRAACACAKELYATRLEESADIMVLNAYPKDTEYSQIGTAYTVLGKSPARCLTETGASVVLATAASEGAGFHALFGPGRPLFAEHDSTVTTREPPAAAHYLFSTGVNESDIRDYYRGAPPSVFGDWGSLLSRISAQYGTARVAIYPLASMQIGY